MADVTMDIASNGSLQTAERDALVIGAGSRASTNCSACATVSDCP